MTDLRALSMVVTMLQGRSGYGQLGRQTTEGFADYLHTKATTYLSQEDAKPSIPVGIEPRQGVTPLASLSVHNDSATPQDAALSERTEDTDVVVIIPAGANGQDDLMQLLAQLLGQEENDDFLRALSSVLEEIMPQQELVEPMTLKDLDDILTKLCDMVTEKKESPELMPLMALFLLQPTPQVPKPVEADTQTAAQATQPIETDTQTAAQAPQPPAADTQPTAQATQPVETDTQPTAQATQPVETDTQSTAQAPQPPATETQSTAQATQPIETDTQPIARPTRPAETDTQPIARPTRPAETDTQPIARPTQPVETDTQPIARPTQPVETDTQPIARPTQPVKTDTQPTTHLTQPVAHDKKAQSQDPQTPINPPQPQQAAPPPATTTETPPPWTAEIQAETVTDTPPPTETPPPAPTNTTPTGTPPPPTNDTQPAMQTTQEVQETQETPEPAQAPTEPTTLLRPKRYTDLGHHRIRFNPAVRHQPNAEQAPANQAPLLTGGEAEPEPLPSITRAAPLSQETPDTGQEDTGTAQKENLLEQAAPTPLSQTAPTPKTSQTAPESPVREALSRSIIDQLVQHAAISKGSDGTTLSMELTPKFLGKLTLVLTATAEGVLAKIRTENDSVRALLSTNMDMLKASLQDAGINMKNIEISNSSIGWDFARGNMGDNPWSGSQQQARYGFENNNGTGRIRSDSFGISGNEDNLPVHSGLYRTGRIAAQQYDDTVFDYRA